MMTLEDFLKDKQLPVKVRWDKRYDHSWVEIVYERKTFYYGHDNCDLCVSLFKTDASREWELYKEPVKLVEWYQWRYRRKNEDAWQISYYYKNEDEFKRFALTPGYEYHRDDESKRLWPE